MIDWICTITFWIGFYRVMGAIISMLTYISNHFKSGSIDLKDKYGDNSWVVITGGANGIGAAFAKQFAKKGFNIFVWDWNKEDIEKVEKDIQSINGAVEFKGVQKDLKAGAGKKFYEGLYEDIKDLDIAIFMNNVGTGSYKPYHEHSHQTVSDTIKLNSILPAAISSLILKKQLTRGKKSALLTMSSASGLAPFSNLPLYS